MAAKESGVAGRESDVAEWEGEDELAGRRSARVHCSLVVRVMSRTAICDGHDAGFVMYLQSRFRAYTPERLSHVP